MSLAACKTLDLAGKQAALPWSMQPKSTGRSCGDLIHALGKPPHRCARSEAWLSQQSISVSQRVPSAKLLSVAGSGY